MFRELGRLVGGGGGGALTLLLRLLGVWGEDVWRAGWGEGVARGGAGRGLLGESMSVRAGQGTVGWSWAVRCRVAALTAGDDSTRAAEP